MNKKYDVFISYRREGGYDTAKHLNDLLVRDGYKVSFDIDTLRNGNFDTQLLSRIDRCKDFILIVDQHAFDRTLDPKFDPQNDWLRCELAYALKKGKNIIPIFLSGVNGFPNNLPSDIAGVIMKNGPEYNRYHFNAFYEDLKKRFLTAKPYKKILSFIGAVLLLVIIIVIIFILTKKENPYEKEYLVNDSSFIFNDSVTIEGNNISSPVIDSTKYYWGKFNEKPLFVKGLRRGIICEAKPIFSGESFQYQYKCGSVIDITTGFTSQVCDDIIFYSKDEEGITVPIDTYFGDIGYNPEGGFEEYRNIYWENQYIIGQCDIDNDNTDELIIAVRTGKDDMLEENTGIGINVFKYSSNGWKRVGELNTSTNVLPASAKIMRNNVFIYWLRYDEKYSYKNGKFICDSDFNGRAFTKDDF